MKIVVTGGTGLIGSKVAAIWQARRRPFATVRLPSGSSRS
ncbi:NAD(P)-dependent oxidoreductase [Mycobacterium sp. KBS0706]|nr:NAD(P)-dependent oxidoreductase [Mycobacterium sp. KBS0706]TSD83899.1 NAD(P)-dependent oxidoreductase [Mycobacterium sp. KBS0706]